MALVFDPAEQGRASAPRLPAKALDTIRSLQAEQGAHDRGYHKDILALPIDRRMTHMSLHMCKYAGQFVEALREDDASRFALTITDAFIISFASANALEIDLAQKLANGLVTPDTRGKPMPMTRTRDPDWFSYRFAALASRLAKASESQDHREEFPIRETMVQCTAAFAQLLWLEAIDRHLNPDALVRARWRDVEAKIDRARKALAGRA